MLALMKEHAVSARLTFSNSLLREEHLADRTGENGLLYNIHYQINPERVGKTAHDYAAVLRRMIDAGEY